MRSLILILMVATVTGCTTKTTDELKTGIWRGVIEMQGQQLPFTFDVVTDKSGGYDVITKNADEKILLDEVILFDDSVSIIMHIFDAQLRAKIKGDSLTGFFTHNYAINYRLPFKAKFNQNFRFTEKSEQSVDVDFTGTYAVNFFTDANANPSPGIGIFKQTGNYVEGTFLRPSGDFRYQEGNIIGNKMFLSGFDGNHLYIFSAELSGDSIKGDFWSGKSRHETWQGVKDENASLPDPESMTYLKEGYDRIDFSFPDITGKKISPSDDKYKGKVLILQIFGTWCPNCLDETKFLSEWYRNNKDRGVEILGLAYEQKPDFDYASKRVKLMKERLNVDYDFVIAGVNDNAKASETLPMLNKVLAFPTTIFVGKDGKVKHINTGFSGPGTGIYYEQGKERFNQVVNELLAE